MSYYVLLLQEQFIFIHDVILESVMCGDTQVSSGDLRSAVTRLTNKDDCTGKTGFETQFEVMHALLLVSLNADQFSLPDIKPGDS